MNSEFKQTSGNVAFAGDFYDEYGNAQYENRHIKNERDGAVDAWSAYEEDDASNGRIVVENDDESFEETPRKRVRIRVPVVRSRSARQHKLTVVRRRPLSSRTRDLAYESTAHTPRRIVVTRVRTLGFGKSIHPIDTPDSEGFQPAAGRHKVTITRRRKLQPSSILTTSTKNKVRVTRKKLVAVRPIIPTPTFAIITTGFFTAPSSEYNNEYSDEDESEEESEEAVKGKSHSVSTPRLEETPNLIDNKPKEGTNLASLETSFVAPEESTSNAPVIITENFFFPPSAEEEDDEYEDDDIGMTTTTESADEVTIPEKDEQHSTTEIISPKEEDNIVFNKSDVEVTIRDGDVTVATTPIDRITSEKSLEEQTIVTKQESDSALTNAVTPISTVLKEETTTEISTKTNILNEDTPTTTLTSVKENNKPMTKEHTTVASPEEATILIDNVTTSSAPDESPRSTNLPVEEVTTMPNATTEASVSPVTEMTTFGMEDKSRGSTDVPDVSASPDATSETPEEILTVQPIRPDVVELDSSSTRTSVIETAFSSSDHAAIAPSFESVVPLETAKSSIRDTDASNYLDHTYIPSVIPLGANYADDSKSSAPETAPSAHETTPVTKVTTKIASPTPEEIEAGLADDLYLSLSRLDFPEILPSKPATLDLETRYTPDLALEPSTSVYYTETVVTSTRLRTYTYVVTQLNGLETKVTSSTTVRPRVTTLTLTVPVTVTVTPTVESSANYVSSVYSPVPVAGE